MDVVEILKKAIKENASDIFFVAGSPCCCWKSLYVEGRTTACCDNTRKNDAE